MGIWYATREDVKSALDFKETARANRAVDRALEAASRSVEGLCHRRFYPEIATRLWDWPNQQYARAWRLWLDANELISVTAVSAAGVVIPALDYNLEPNEYGPPFNRLELDIASNATFGGGATHQRNISISGLFGYRNDETITGTITEALDASETGVDVDAATSAAVGVGSLLRVDGERMAVTGRSMLDTGQTLGADLTNQVSAVTVPVASGAAFAVDEVVLIDAERMLITDIAGNQLIVKRGWDGTVLAAHTTGAHVYAPRTLTVQRAVLGTIASTHALGATVARWDPPGPVNQLTIAEALNQVLQEQAGWLRVTGGSGGQKEATLAALVALREQVWDSHGRKARTRAV
ncbi:hypothetical protein [Streptomyces violascens]|uniref:Uncharacterized protein n=1 Tax=Streptomyces violascens TaxID=67381 RepID=A0ABQ3QXB1_9ACTN|nr:hypothetical protein [Streptomyces violascens]GGU13253.1 hypothetical protein GCM10010289_38660 [Streptomyces violascens]GHI41916.1 hypothetical protein Sviol_63240 [Streptomyces violascens]